MSWNVSTDNVTDTDTLWDWDALIQNGTIIFMAASFIAQETPPLQPLTLTKDPDVP